MKRNEANLDDLLFDQSNQVKQLKDKYERLFELLKTSGSDLEKIHFKIFEMCKKYCDENKIKEILSNKDKTINENYSILLEYFIKEQTK